MSVTDEKQPVEEPQERQDDAAPVEPEGERVPEASPAAEPEQAEEPTPDPEPEKAEKAASPTAYQRLGHALRPSVSRSQLLAGVLCALLGFALVVQVRQSGQDDLSSLRQDDLVRLLDEVTNRADQLDAEVSRLRSSRDELQSGTGQAQAALDLARQRATSEGILSGRLPAQGPGVTIDVQDPQGNLRAAQMFNLLEELRNAGAEVVQVNDVRLVTSSSFVDAGGAIQVDGTRLTAPYRFTVIGDPATLDRALEIPGGALPTIRNKGATATTVQQQKVTVDATVRLTDPRYAKATDPNGD